MDALTILTPEREAEIRKQWKATRKIADADIEDILSELALLRAERDAMLHDLTVTHGLYATDKRPADASDWFRINHTSLQQPTYRGWIGLVSTDVDAPYEFVDGKTRAEIKQRCDQLVDEIAPRMTGDFMLFMRDGASQRIIYEVGGNGAVDGH